MRSTAVTICLATLLASGNVSAQPVAAGADAASHAIRFELREGDRVIGQPGFTLRLGEPASMAVGGPNGYALGVVLARADEGAAAPGQARYLVRSGFYRPAPTGWSLVASPSFTIVEGNSARISIDRVPQPPLSIAVSVP